MTASRILLAVSWACFALASGPVIALDPVLDEEEKALMSAMQELTKLSPEEKASKLTGLVQKYDALVKDKLLEITTVPGKLSPPKVLIGGDEGWNPASDGEGTLSRLFPGNPEQHKIGERAVMLESLLIHFAPEDAFKRMVPRLGSAEPTLKDAMHLLAACHRQPGMPLTKQIPKELWLQFYNSPNPCYKILALEKYDSTAQSPEELLKHYRECLFHTFGYLQVRALEGIYRSRDTRPEVQVLLKEFLKSSPVENDGTLPTYPAIIRNPIEGAERILLRHLWLARPQRMSQSDRAKWEQAVLQAKDLSTHLEYEIHRAWYSRERETLRLAWEALAYRSDLSPDQLAGLAHWVNEMLKAGINANPKDDIATTYAAGFVRTLGHYPSPEHEALAIALTESDDGSVYANAALTLAKIGGPSSIGPMKKLVERAGAREGTKSSLYDTVSAASRDLDLRLAGIKDTPAAK